MLRNQAAGCNFRKGFYAKGYKLAASWLNPACRHVLEGPQISLFFNLNERPKCANQENHTHTKQKQKKKKKNPHSSLKYLCAQAQVLQMAPGSTTPFPPCWLRQPFVISTLVLSHQARFMGQGVSRADFPKVQFK